MQSLENVSFQIEKECREKPEQIGTPEQIFFSVLSGKLKVDEQTQAYLESRYHIDCHERMSLLCVYHGEQVSSEETRRQIRHVLSSYPGLDCYYPDLVYRNTVTVVLKGYRDLKDLERWVQQQILQRSRQKMAVGWIEVDDLNALGEGFSLLYPYLDWNISMDHKVLICYPQIRNVQTAPCNYPIDLERDTFAALARGDVAGTRDRSIDFFAWMAAKDPEDLNSMRLKVLELVLRAEYDAFKTGSVNYAYDYRKDYLTQVNALMDPEQIRNWFLDRMTSISSVIRDQNEEQSETTVSRACKYIQENFRKDISLDDVSKEVNVSPYYFSKLFKEEVGENFIDYLTRLRIECSKELLRRAALTIREAGLQSGYSDPNYFSRIFKKQTGMTPREYREQNT